MEKTIKLLKQTSYLYGVLLWEIHTKNKVKTASFVQDYLTQLTIDRKNLLTDDKFYQAILEAQKDPKNKRHCEILLKFVDNAKKFSEEFIQETQKIRFEANQKWEEARQKNDYSIYEAALLASIDNAKKNAEIMATCDNLYDTLLDSFEENFTTKEYDEIFKVIEEQLVPFVKEVIANKAVQPKLLNDDCLDEQKIMKDWIVDIMEFDLARGEISESVHPFCMGLSTQDVRLTTKYTNNPLSSMKSLFHELGHAKYEQGFDTNLENTLLDSSASLAFHESQSRFYEIFIFTNETFLKTHFDKIKTIFPMYAHLNEKEFYKYVNDVSPSYSRVEADELTYPLHILLRYNIEKELFNGLLDPKDAKKRWNELYFKYFNIEVDEDNNGILQDVHWSAGQFGYFPTYLLGTAFAAQFLNTMKKELNFEKVLSSGNLKPIHEWLHQNIHQKAATKTQLEILEEVTGESFNIQYLIEYLKNKYQKIFL